MSPRIVPCSSCAGAKGTEKTQHTVEVDAQGNQVAVEHRYWSPCNGCGGAGTVVQG